MLGLSISRLVRALVAPLVPPAQGGAVDVIVVLGAPVPPGGALGLSLRERVEAGVDAWRAGRAGYVLFTGGRTDGSPLADLRSGLAALVGKVSREERSDLAEAEAMRRHALALGVPESAILVEAEAHSTEENARFAARMMRERGLRRALVVTQPYHLRRSLALFARAGVDAEPLVLDESWIYRGGWDSVRSLRWVTREYIILAGSRLLRR